MLLSDGFGGFGGIAKFNRDFLQGLDASAAVNRVEAVPRLISEPIDSVMPESVVYDRRAARGKIAFVRRAAAHTWYNNRMDVVVCGHINLLRVAYLIARYRKARLVLIIHGIDAWQPTDSALTNFLARHVDQYVAVSKFSAGKFAEWSGHSHAQSFVLPNCVDLERFVPMARDAALVERYGLAGKKVVMTLGRLAAKERYKGFDEVLEVMPNLIARFPGLKYLIVGDGEDAPRLKSKANSLGIEDHVIFAGRIPESEKVAHYSLADAYVMPSSGEGFGIVLIEAAASGVPVIGSSADGSREALLDGRLGKLVNPEKPDEIIDAISKTLDAAAAHARLPEIETFGVDRFRARVHDWACRQSDARIAGRAAA